MTFRDRVHERARRAGRRVVLPEGDDARVRAAADRLRSEGLARVEVLGPVGDDPRIPVELLPDAADAGCRGMKIASWSRCVRGPG